MGFRPAAIAVLALLAAAPTAVLAQSECMVTSTYMGFWTRAELNCGGGATAPPRVAVVVSEALRTCPILAGDRVAVTYLNDDPARQPSVTAVQARGDGGPSSGNWCSRAFPPGRYTGPCKLEETPPRAERADTLGASWVQTVIQTQFRNTADNRWKVGTDCGAWELKPGVYRIYVTEEIWRTTWRPCPNVPIGDQPRLCEDATLGTNRYEGGIYIDGGLARVDSVTDVSPLVRGWSGSAATAIAGEIPPPLFVTNALRMTGKGLGVPWLSTSTIRMTGAGVGVPWLVTDTLRMSGKGTSSSGKQ